MSSSLISLILSGIKAPTGVNMKKNGIIKNIIIKDAIIKNKTTRNKKSRKNMSIISLFIITFTLLLLITSGGIALFIFSSWKTSARSSTLEIASKMNQDVFNQIDSYIQIPITINTVNHKLIENNGFYMDNEDARNKYFVSVLSAYNKNVYSFSYGTANGEYYGARLDENGNMEIIKNNAQTNGESWYYYVNDNMTAGSFAVNAGKFDPRTREWYKSAVQTGGPVFSQVYKHFVMDDLTLSAAWPVYDKNRELKGVLGTHMLLADIGNHLKEITSSNNSSVIIIEKDTGYLIANSIGAGNYSTSDNGDINRKTIADINNSSIQKGYEEYLNSGKTELSISHQKENAFINIQQYQQPGLDWLIISTVPKNLLISELDKNISMTVWYVIGSLLLSFVIYFIITRRLLNPMKNLLNTSKKIETGDLSARVAIVRDDEIGEISEAFNNLADNMQHLIINLEDQVATRTKELRFLSNHDYMTGLLNRRSFENKMKEMDTNDNLPISIIFIDINGLKMVNDTFGHTNGDKLIMEASQVLKANIRDTDLLARTGGDEFVMLLIKTQQQVANLLATKIEKEFSQKKIKAITCSMATGVDTKTKHYQEIEKILENAENEMYKEKIASRKSFGTGAIMSIINALHEKSAFDKAHSEEVSILCEQIGHVMNLNETEIKQLRDAGYLHDIGKIALSDEILSKDTHKLTEIDKEMQRQHPAVSYRILSMSEDTLDLANGVYGHHERWDGSGYPKGLKGEEIPLISRIIAIAEAYSRKMISSDNTQTSKENALNSIIRDSGKKYDPYIVELFVNMINNKK
ncbi:diguanylate cyclase [[Clostridium] fimetarium]|uniref:Diguanylate cyclase (GGDEF) domain-containing protein n=1 Tax=[Clostridium] fimetarium TaxID=99656 RepID=A0A1I0PL22_9FIRM|nr:diguanylate cyclase [[Clostridium] fimetarium]SEW14528.1 diguanylate cyclase (GGDEF) domain-containing protein [[Clostridium] fimetarium]